MQLDPVDLVALVGSRIAHDLANPLGAIANGVELLALTGQGDIHLLRKRILGFRFKFAVARGRHR